MPLLYQGSPDGTYFKSCTLGNVYIAGSGHSGSTLLDMLLGGHNQIKGSPQSLVVSLDSVYRHKK
jgi:hypothetical protein